MGFGILTISLPLLVLQRLHRGAALVGALWAALGVGGIVAGAIAGHLGSEGRERRLMAGASAASVAAMTLVAVSSSLALVVAGMLLLGIANGPYAIGLFSLRQRRTPPAWLGRAFAVSMSLNFLGFPVGTAIGGVLVAHSLDLALLVAVLTLVVATALPLTLIPAHPDPDATD